MVHHCNRASIFKCRTVSFPFYNRLLNHNLYLSGFWYIPRIIILEHYKNSKDQGCSFFFLLIQSYWYKPKNKNKELHISPHLSGLISNISNHNWTKNKHSDIAAWGSNSVSLFFPAPTYFCHRIIQSATNNDDVKLESFEYSWRFLGNFRQVRPLL